MRINVYLYGILALILFLGTVQVAQAAGYYNTSGKVSVKGEAIVLTTSSDPSSIKGWMTIGDVSKAFNIPIEKIVAEFKLPATVTPETALKDLESDTFNVTKLRDWVTKQVKK